MADEVTRTTATVRTLESNGAQITTAAFVQADDETLTPANCSYFPRGDFVLAGAFSGAPTAGDYINLFMRLMGVSGANNAPVPDASYEYKWVGRFLCDVDASTHYMTCLDVELPIFNADYYLQNKCASVTLSTGWTLKVTPHSWVPGA